MYPYYSPDVAPSEYYQLRSTAIDFDGKKFASREAHKNRLSHFLPKMARVFMSVSCYVFHKTTSK